MAESRRALVPRVRWNRGVGQTYYFTWLDGQFTKLEKKAAADGTASKVWMVHSGGFYAVEKQESLGVRAEQVRWFRWEALMTWLGGMVLLVLVYYLGAGLIDPDVADISKPAGIAIGFGVLVVGWLIYDAAVLSPIGKAPAAFAFFALVTRRQVSWGLHVLSGRSLHSHGSDFGTIMTANVWFRILGATKRMVLAAAAASSTQRLARRPSYALSTIRLAVPLFSYAEPSLPGRDLREPVWLAGADCARGARVGSCETDSRSLF